MRPNRTPIARRRLAGLVGLSLCLTGLGVTAPAYGSPAATHSSTTAERGPGAVSAKTLAAASTGGSVPGNVRLARIRHSLLATHYWYRQYSHGRRVVGGWYARHVYKDGQVLVWDGRRRVGGTASAATLGPVQAKGRAATSERVPRSAAAAGTLMVLPKTPRTDGPRLVWPVDLTTGAGAGTVFVDARTGRVLETVGSLRLRAATAGVMSRGVSSTARRVAAAGMTVRSAVARLTARGAVAGMTMRSAVAGLTARSAVAGMAVRSAVAATSAPTWVTGRGRVFRLNPVVTLQNEHLTDLGDANKAVPLRAYSRVALPDLSPNHTLGGRWVRLVGTTPAASTQDRYFFYRSSNTFEQVQAYYAIDAEQRYLQRLGFSDANSRSQPVAVNAVKSDNSYFDASTGRIRTGTGGVDDAEDPEVLWHEYGHAIGFDQVLDFPWTRRTTAIGEGFGDYMAVTMSQVEGAPDTHRTPLSCVADWDSTAYTATVPHCLRRVDTSKTYPANLTGEPHQDGEIWSRALWDMNQSAVIGRNRATRIIVEAQFFFNPTITMPAAARLTVNTARRLYGGSTARRARRAFEARGILQPR